MPLPANWSTNDQFTAADQNAVEALVNTHTTQIATNTSAISALGGGDPIDLAALSSAVDFGFCQSEIGNQDWFSESEIRDTLQGMKDAGATWVRFAIWWRGVEQTAVPGEYTWTGTDRCLNLIQEYGLQPLACITQGGAPLLFTATLAHLSNLCSAIAARYGTGGTGQLHHYEIWNEPNNSVQYAPFGSSFGAAHYTSLMTAASAALRAADEDAYILGGSLMSTATFSTTDISPSDFLQGIYDNGGADAFDALAFHWYSGASDFSGFQEPTRDQEFYLEMVECREIMVTEGDSAKDMWITEFGFPITLPDNQRADWMAKQIELIYDLDYVKRGFVYNFRPGVEAESDPSSQYGTVDFDFSPKQPIYNYIASINAIVPAALSASGSGSGTGDMEVSVYDPGEIAADVFDRANHTGIQNIGTTTGTTVQFNGALSDANFYTTGGTDVTLGDGGTGASLVDPGADRIMFWDDSAGTSAWLTPGTNLSISGDTLNATAGSGGGGGSWGVFEGTIGDGSDTSIDVTHNLGGPVVVGVRDAATDEVVYCKVLLTNDNTATLEFETAPATSSLIVTVVGGTSNAVAMNTQTASYTLVLADSGKAVEVNNASANTLTVPPNSSVAFPIGTVIEVTQMGAGQTTLTPGSGVTLQSRGAALKLSGQYAVAALRKRNTNEWVVAGDVTT